MADLIEGQAYPPILASATVIHEIVDSSVVIHTIVDSGALTATLSGSLAAGSAIIGKAGIDQTAGQNIVGIQAGTAVIGHVIVDTGSTTQVTATIANGVAVATFVDLANLALLGIHMPGAWSAANLTFQASEDGVTYSNLYDYTGTEINVVAAASVFIRLNPADWVGIRYLIVRSGTSGTPVNQGAQRLIVLVTKAV